MSIKAFHIIFISISDLLAVGCAWWGFTSQIALFGAISAVAAVGLFIYGIFFVRKSRKLIL